MLNGFHSIEEIARACGGEVSGGQARVPGPGHSAKDRSLSIKICAVHKDGFLCHSFAGDNPIVCRDYVRQKLGMGPWQPGATRERPPIARRPAPIATQTAAARVMVEASAALPPCERPEKFIQGEGDGPPAHPCELRRHVYRRDGVAVRVKIKIQSRNGSTRFQNWYRVVKDDSTGWQAQKPSGFIAVPYVGAVTPFDPELAADDVLWPEGERDVDTLAGLGLPAFTFGGTGDGLPAEAAAYLCGRRLVILADNDKQGREHAEKKAAVAHDAGAASVRVVHFPELPEHSDVSDFMAAGGTAEALQARIDAAPYWTPATAQPAQAGLEVTCLANVKAQPIEWLWQDWLAVGKVHVLAGDGGLGKSTILCDLAARTSTGSAWPDRATNGDMGGSVIILAAEDDVADTLKPRLVAAGADPERIFVIRSVRSDDLSRRTFSLQADLPRLEAEIEARGDCRLVIIDPVSSYLGKVDSHKNAEVRMVLEPLGEMAARMRMAVICNNHLSKGTGGANHRIIGSVAFVNQARAAFIVAPDAENEGRVLLMPSKMNIAPMKHGLAYRIESLLIRVDDTEILTSRISWESEPVKISADQALAALDGGREAKSQKAEAIEILNDILAAGPVSAAEVKRRATEAGVSPKALRSAREALGVVTQKAGFGEGWVWTLPKMPSDPEDARLSTWAPSGPLGTFGDDGSR
jgi:putative DNA primase/helicase